MPAGHAKQLVEGYLGRLELELLDLPSDRRREIVDCLRNHITDARTGLPRETDAALMNLLERLGDPAEIAAAARDGKSTSLQSAAAGHGGVGEGLALLSTPLLWPA